MLAWNGALLEDSPDIAEGGLEAREDADDKAGSAGSAAQAAAIRLRRFSSGKRMERGRLREGSAGGGGGDGDGDGDADDKVGGTTAAEEGAPRDRGRRF